MVTAVRRANPFSYLSGACFVKRETTYIRRGSLNCERVKRVYWVLGVVGSGPHQSECATAWLRPPANHDHGRRAITEL